MVRRGFLVPPGDEKALAKKIRWILINPEKARAMGECARAVRGAAIFDGKLPKGLQADL